MDRVKKVSHGHPVSEFPNWPVQKPALPIPLTPISAGDNSMTIFGCSGVDELDLMIGEPWDRGAVFVELCFAQDRVVTATIEVDDDAVVGFDFNGSGSFDELPIQRFSLAAVESVKLVRQPAVTAVGKDRQDCINIHVQPYFARQTVQVKEVYTAAQRVFDSVPPRVVRDEVA